MHEDCQRRHVLALGLWAMGLSGCATSAALAQASRATAAPAAANISAIRLERDCTACAAGSLLVLRRDGTASFTQTGKSRLGTEDKSARGNVTAADFDALARMLVARGFFQLQDSYADPELQDGAWSTLSAVLDGQDKRVFRREAAGPADLQAIEVAIEAVRSGIRFTAVR
jgi:hypothetical protein